MKFEDFGLAEPILRSIVEEGYSEPTPIQIKAIPLLIAGSDVLGCAQTGTGKTAAFALPILHSFASSHRPDKGRRRIRALVLSPTRELAVQIAESFRVYGRYIGLRHTVVYGGVNQNPQTRALKDGVDILVATPGRLLDLIGQGFVDLRRVEVFVLDEGDHMLDMGFIPDVRKIIAQLPANRQTLLFSATIPDEIRRLADTMLHQPVSVNVTPETVAVDTVDHSVYFVDSRKKPQLLVHFLRNTSIKRTLVFTRTKHGADRVVKRLRAADINAAAIHSNKSQQSRQRTLKSFKTGQIQVLVATDIAARGLDIDDVTHVINFDLPNVPETYVHRIGRSGRAGASGSAVSFCGKEERAFLKSIERLIRKTIKVCKDQPDYLAGPGQPPSRSSQPKGSQPKGGRPKDRRPKTTGRSVRSGSPKSHYGNDQKSGRRGSR